MLKGAKSSCPVFLTIEWQCMKTAFIEDGDGEIAVRRFLYFEYLTNHLNSVGMTALISSIDGFRLDLHPDLR